MISLLRPTSILCGSGLAYFAVRAAFARLGRFYEQDGHEALQIKYPFFARHPDLLRWGLIGTLFAVSSVIFIVSDKFK